MTNIFPNIKIDNKDYPTIILGEDLFTDWFPKCKVHFSKEEDRSKYYLEILQISYDLGVRGFSISPHVTLLETLREFKNTHSDIICIANPHYKSHYYLGNNSLWENPYWDQINMTAKGKVGIIETNEQSLCEEEISKIDLNIEEFKARLNLFNNFCDFCIVGNLGFSCLQIMDRIDIVKKEIELVKETYMTPIGISESGGIGLSLMQNLNLQGFWVKLNRDLQLPSSEKLQAAIKNYNKPISGYKIFGLKSSFNFEESIKFIKNFPQIKSIVVGVENREQAIETFTQLHKYY